ncbi:uncharacterized protein LOC130990730 [Salvia miltiorrhiza]|uniref:uncharacterized protein LOC130990730 n=1 Tax=Salvia miltiorrhiza TaxID=226208 RepID=UPI0025ACBA9A|nr:uncharacterized protein LOC130990730 [Salvia miltiorrhiza]
MTSPGGLNLPIVSNNFACNNSPMNDYTKTGAGLAGGNGADSAFVEEREVAIPNTTAISNPNDSDVGADNMPKSKSYADITMNRPPRRPDLPAHRFHSLRPTKEGEQFSLKVPQHLYAQEVSKEFSHAIIGRLFLRKGDKPQPALLLKAELHKIWKLESEWQLIPLGKGYYTLVFRTPEDKTRAKAKPVWELSCGHVRLREWSKHFDPFKENSSMANVWVRIHYLPIEYWHPEILAGIGRYIGHPIKIDGASARRDFGQFAHLLIELDMSKSFPTTLLIDNDSFSFYVEFTYENLPFYCSKCKLTGHPIEKCRKISVKKTVVEEDVQDRSQMPLVKNGKQWQPISGDARDEREHEQETAKGDRPVEVGSRSDIQLSLPVSASNNSFALLANEGTDLLEEPEQQRRVPLSRGKSLDDSNSAEHYGPDRLAECLKPCKNSVFDQPVNISAINDGHISEEVSDEDEEVNYDSSGKYVSTTDDIAVNNALKAQRLEQILAIAKAPMPETVAPAKRRGRPSKQDQAARAAENTANRPADTSIKSRLRNTGDTSRTFVIDTSNRDSALAMESVAKESWAEEVVVVDCLWHSYDFRIAFVHGSNDQNDRRDLWHDLLRFVSGKMVFMGDFNAVKGAHERLSLASPHRGSCEEFCDFIDDSGFIESPTEGLRFTWSGRRFLPHHVESVLDRALFSQGFADLWSSLVTAVLPRLTSDHSPLVLQCKLTNPTGRRPFRFLNMWTLHPTFQELVATSWREIVSTRCPILCVMLKLKRLRKEIGVWNKEVFGNVDSSISSLMKQLETTQGKISASGYTNDLFDEEVSFQAKLNVSLTHKNCLLQQKSRANWLRDGDRNTEFFHRLTKFKKRNAPFTRLKIDGRETYDATIIENHIIDHFTSLFADDGRPSGDQLEIDALFQSGVSDDQNARLVSIPDESEIAATVFNMDASSAPGPDGFSGNFFQSCWDVIKADVIAAVQNFFRHSYLPSGCNSSTMILIPKKDSVDTVADLRPIVLSNFLFKIISKILASRLGVVAASHVSDNQFGFISGRNIHDCIMLSSEGFNCMKRTDRGRNMACKVDIRKAFDTIRWDFILQVLRANHYHEKFIYWISIIFSSARLSILYNGQLRGYFACSRGVRQGDPLSPILFGIAEDILSRLFSSCVDSGHLEPMRYSRTFQFPTHLFYADDVMIFCKATVRNARKIHQIFSYYDSLSGQQCSLEKSCIYFGSGVLNDRKSAIHRELSFTTGNLPFNYLGVLIFVGRPRASFFQAIHDRIVQKFARWKGRHLSMAGRLCLVKSVIQSSIVHSMMVYKWPKSLLHSLDRKCRNFVWSGNIDKRPSCAVSWGRVCSPLKEGGLGIRSFTLMNKSYLMKLAWKLIQGTVWAHSILRSRYLNNFGVAKDSVSNSSVWIGMKEEVNQLVDDSYIQSKKGSGKRLKSRFEIEAEKAKKPKRLCKKCGRRARHDSRNCGKVVEEDSEED